MYIFEAELKENLTLTLLLEYVNLLTKKDYEMAEKKPKSTVTRKLVTKSPEILAAETLIAVTSSTTIQEAADILGITRKQVHERIVKYELKERIQQLKENALTELTMGAPKAAQKLVKLIDSDNEQIAKTASDSVLDRVGVTKSDNQNTNIFLGDVQFVNSVPRPERNQVEPA